VRELGKISTRYLYDGLVVEMIPLIPFQTLELDNNINCLFYLVKLMRMWQGFKILDIP